MNVFIIDQLTKNFYAVACSQNLKGYISSSNDFGSPNENDFPFWTNNISKAFKFSSILNAENEIKLNDLTCNNTITPEIISF